MKRKLLILLGAVLAVLLWQGLTIAGYGPEPVGYVQVSDGDVVAINSESLVVRANNQEECRRLGRGAGVYANDIIITGAESKLQIMFLDGSMLVVGDETQIKVGEFQYNYEDPQQNEQEVTLVSGQCRFASGRIVETRPEGMALGTPELYLDLQGTEVGLSVSIKNYSLAALAAQLSSMFSDPDNMTQEEREQARAYLSQVLPSVLGAASDLREMLEISVAYFSSSGTGHSVDVTLHDISGNEIGHFMLMEDQVLVIGPDGSATVLDLTLGMVGEFITTMINRFSEVPGQLRGTQDRDNQSKGGQSESNTECTSSSSSSSGSY